MDISNAAILLASAALGEDVKKLLSSGRLSMAAGILVTLGFATGSRTCSTRPGTPLPMVRPWAGRRAEGQELVD